MENEINDLKKFISQIKKFQRIKKCFYYEQEKCSENIIDAHTISMSSNMKLIKGIIAKNEKVYTLSERILDNAQTERFLEDIGWSKASTFNGFCGHHDRTTFLSIEDNHPFEIEKLEHLFLQSYRSFAYGYHKKMEFYKTRTKDSPLIKKLLETFDLVEPLQNLFEQLKQNLQPILSQNPSILIQIEPILKQQLIQKGIYNETTAKMIKVWIETGFESAYADLIPLFTTLKEGLAKNRRFTLSDLLEECKLKINYLLKKKFTAA